LVRLCKGHLLTAGANDAVLEGEPQHVPLDRYKDNLHRLIDLVSSADSAYQSPETKIILINPPPIIADKWHRKCHDQRVERGEPGPDKPNRDPLQSQRYSEACVEVAKEAGVPYVDIFNKLIAAAGGNDSVKLDPYL
jgi:lysophospholipase L1-like esterase